MKIYTKTGDGGQTDLIGGRRVAKDHARVEACGTIDELNATLGVAYAELVELDPPTARMIMHLQRRLFSLGTELAMPSNGTTTVSEIGEADTLRLEVSIDRMTAELPPLHDFILPGPTRAAASLHLARTVCRRAERRVVTLATTPGCPVAAGSLIFLNRLSDWLFTAARMANHRAGAAETTRFAKDQQAE